MVPSNLIVSKYTQGSEFIRADNYASYQGYYYELRGKTYIGKEFNINAVEFTGLVHQGIKTKLGYNDFYIPFYGKNYIEHYWATSIISLYKKHKRYLINEGESKYSKGERINLFKVILTPFNTFLTSFFTLKGYSDYYIGFLLSIFNAWYQYNVNLNLYRYQKNKK